MLLRFELPGRLVDVQIGEFRRVEHRVFVALPQLVAIVVQHPQADRKQHHDGQQVDQRQHPHHRIGEEEHRGGARRGGADHHQPDDQDTQDVQVKTAVGKHLQRILSQIVVVDDGAEGEEQDRRRQKVLAPGADMRHQRLLRQHHPVDPFRSGHIDIAQQDHEGGAGANEDGVDEHRQRLHDALADRVSNVGDGGHVRRAAQAGLVGEQPAAQAVGDGCPHAAADGFLEPEGVGDDGADHRRHFRDVHQHDDQGHADIAQGHDRHDDVGHLGNPLDAAIHDDPGNDGECQAGPQPVEAETVVHRTGHRVALEGIEAQRKGGDQRYRVDDGQPAVLPAQAVDNVLRRPAAIGAVLFRALVDLGQGAFEQAGRHADQGDRPHPEDRAGAAQRDCHRHAGDVAAADPAADADEQRRARTDPPLGVRLLAREQDPEHAFEEPELNAAGRQREENPQHDKERDQRPPPGSLADGPEDCFQVFHVSCRLCSGCGEPDALGALSCSWLRRKRALAQTATEGRGVHAGTASASRARR